MALRVFDDQGNGEFAWIESALDWVHLHQNSFENPITTVNLSLGADWNANEIPGWAMLEDEFAQLESDGIFIAVAAGNGFRDEHAVGLSYPAASSFVVPVASADSAGKLSDFSQRNDRVIVAPGESISSTAPDYLYGFNGVTDDFARASGTSMAAPFVAGASTLVREAWQLAGITGIRQDALYDHLRSTADTVYDPVTGLTYDLLNLERALDGALPQDDHGNSVDTATRLGTLSNSLVVDGFFSSLRDADVVTLVASRTGTVTVTTTDMGYAKSRVRLLGSDSPFSGSFPVVAGQAYSLALTTDGGIGKYQLGLTLDSSAADLGRVDRLSFSQPATLGTRQSFALTAANTGWFTVSAAGSTSGQVALVNTAGTTLATANFSAGTAHLNVPATRGAGLSPGSDGHQSNHSNSPHKPGGSLRQ